MGLDIARSPRDDVGSVGRCGKVRPNIRGVIRGPNRFVRVLVTREVHVHAILVEERLKGGLKGLAVGRGDARGARV